MTEWEGHPRRVGTSSLQRSLLPPVSVLKISHQGAEEDRRQPRLEGRCSGLWEFCLCSSPFQVSLERQELGPGGWSRKCPPGFLDTESFSQHAGVEPFPHTFIAFPH